MSNSEVTPKYSSIRMSVPADLTEEFLLECKQAGVDKLKYSTLALSNIHFVSAT
ncbi:hypothetical protein [Providencia rettgeri]|uniref:hypothetical protein n=1 Tax=Providencia rettgeri TaxID=587 RepID=UPI0024AB7EFE|nr:hypothetical protein [Providencia rettgeri]ELR5199773.1 hypothetical protein [Providencia rettgeri]MDL9988006.1 hypothetical protein [Providencia rettgeri]